MNTTVIVLGAAFVAMIVLIMIIRMIEYPGAIEEYELGWQLALDGHSRKEAELYGSICAAGWDDYHEIMVDW